MPGRGARLFVLTSSPPLQPKLAMRAEANEFQACVVGFAIYQNEVRFDVAVPVIAPLAAERVIEIAPGQLFVVRQQRHGLQQIGVEIGRASCRERV